MSKITINLHDQPCGNCTVCIGRNIGAKHEQERIIKLIEDDMATNYKEYSGEMEWGFHRAIELIKEETNE